jgi:Domain of unknown function (DUF3850)
MSTPKRPAAKQPLSRRMWAHRSNTNMFSAVYATKCEEWTDPVVVIRCDAAAVEELREKVKGIVIPNLAEHTDKIAVVDHSMKTHELKTWPSFFEAVLNGSKTFECRRNDRDFAPGDTIVLKEFDPEHNPRFDDCVFTGRTLTRKVGFVVHGGVFGIQPGHCVMSLLPSSRD